MPTSMFPPLPPPSLSPWYCMYRTLLLLRPLRCYAPPPLQREVTAKGHFLLPYMPPHLHMHTCVWLALTSMFTLVYVVRGGGVTTQRCMQFSLLRPPPLFSTKLRFKRGGVTTREYGMSPSCLIYATVLDG